MNTQSFLIQILNRLIMLVLVFFWINHHAFAQTTEDRINQDAKIMQSIFTELLKANGLSTGFSGGSQLWTNTSHKESYEPGFGIILKATGSGNNTFFDNGYSYHTAWGVARDNEKSKLIIKDKEKDSNNVDSLFFYFLKNYGDLSRNLDSDEWLMLQYNPFTNRYPGTAQVGIHSNSATEKNTVSAKVKYKWIEAFKSGNLSEPQFKEKVVFQSARTNEGEGLETQILERILKEKIDYVYDSVSDKNESNRISGFSVAGDHSSTINYATTWSLNSRFGKVDSRNIPGYGTVFKVYMSQLQHPVLLKVQGKEKPKGADLLEQDKEGWDQRITALYKIAKPEFKLALVEYGRTLRSLASDEYIKVVVSMPFCYECDVPAKIAYRVKKSVLESFDARKLTLEKALDAVEVLEEGKAKDLEQTYRVKGNSNLRFLPDED